MKNLHKVALAALLAASGSASMAQVVGVSWPTFQEERYKIEEKAIKEELAKLGASYISADAAHSADKQISDVDALINKGAKVLILMAEDKDAIGPALAQAKARGIPVIAYDRLIENPDVFYLSFDNKAVGRLQAEAVLAKRPKGNYAMIKGAASNPNAHILREGQQEALAAAIKRGDVKIVGDEFTEDWKPENAQKEMEQILTRTGGKVDAVVSSNDGMAGGVVAALSARGIKGVPVSGQDGDLAALNRVALGTQTVSVWKDVRVQGTEGAKIAVMLAKGQKVPGAKVFNSGEKKVPVNSILLTPIPITQGNLDLVLKANWISKDELCRGVDKATGPAACK